MATGSIKHNVDIYVRRSNSISVQIPSSGRGTVATSYNDTPPSGYQLVSRQFMRTDDGGWQVGIWTPLDHNHILYESLGSTPTLTGYVVDVFVKL